MFSLSTAMVTALLATASFAAPPALQRRVSVSAAGDNGSCATLYASCVKGVKKAGASAFLADPFGFSNQCTLAAVCHGATVDDFLYDVYHSVARGRKVPHSKTSTRLPKKYYNRIANSVSGKRDLEARAIASQQHFIDYYFSTMTTLGGPYPQSSYVVRLWADVAAWTGFCSGGRSIPYMNLADWFQHSASSDYYPTCGSSSSGSGSGAGSTITTTRRTTVVGGSTSVAGGTTSVVQGVTTVYGGTSTVYGGTTITIAGGTTTIGGGAVTTTIGGGADTTTTGGGAVTTTIGGGAVTTTVAAGGGGSGATTTSSGSAASASAFHVAVYDMNGNLQGYASTDGVVTPSPEDSFQRGTTTSRKVKRQSTFIDLFNPDDNTFLCGIGGDLSTSSDFVLSGGCQTSTGQGATHDATGYETTIFTLGSGNALDAYWIDSNGTTVEVILTFGTYNGVADRLVFVIDSSAPIFDGNATGMTVMAIAVPVDTTASATVTTSSAASTTTSGAQASASDFAALDASGNVLGYVSASGVLTTSPSDPLIPQSQNGSSPFDLYDGSSGTYLCFTGGDLSSSTDYVVAGSCPTSTGAGATHDATGSESTIFSIDPSTGATTAQWVNSDGVTVRGFFVKGTLNGVPNTLLLVSDPNAAVFDGGVAGTAVSELSARAATSATTTSATGASTSSATASASPSNFAVVDSNGSVLGYITSSGDITASPSDALTAQSASGGNPVDLFSASTGKYLCGIGGDLSSNTDYVRAGSCNTSTGAGATDARGQETTIFNVDPSTGLASPIWVNSDGTVVPAFYVEGTLGGVPNTVLLVSDPNAAVFDGGVAGTQVTVTSDPSSTSSSASVSATATSTSSSASATATTANFKVVDASGNLLGYVSTSGVVTSDPSDPLAAVSVSGTSSVDLYSPSTSNFFCGIGGDLSSSTSYVTTGGCDTATGADATHDATGSETAIFTVDPSSGVATATWVNSDGTSQRAFYVEGTLNGVPNTLLLVADPSAPVFDGNTAGTAVIITSGDIGSGVGSSTSSASASSTSASSSSTTPSAPTTTATTANFAAVDSNGNLLGYVNTDGTVTTNPEDPLSAQSAGGSSPVDLYSPSTGEYFCGIGGDLSSNTNYVTTGGCTSSTGPGSTYTPTGFETTIFTIDPSTGVATPTWVNADGTSVPAFYVEGTLNGVPNTLLLVSDTNAAVFDGDVAGTEVTVTSQPPSTTSATTSSTSTSTTPTTSSTTSTSTTPTSTTSTSPTTSTTSTSTTPTTTSTTSTSTTPTTTSSSTTSMTSVTTGETTQTLTLTSTGTTSTPFTTTTTGTTTLTDANGTPTATETITGTSTGTGESTFTTETTTTSVGPTTNTIIFVSVSV